MTTLISSTTPAPAPVPLSTDWTAADLVERFGPIPLWRIRFDPPPGTATEEDAVAIWEREKRLCELVDGTLVEKTVGYQEAYLAVLLARLIGNFVEAAGLGIVLGADGMAKLAPGLLRIPDVSFIPWERHPDRKVPKLPYVPFAPSLAVEVLSPSNTAKEMSRKLDDYFRTGVRLVWYVDPETRTVEVFTARERSTMLKEGDTLEGGEVLPGFRVPVARLFAELTPKPAG
jgi:Uma2 family endonuclease